MKKLSLYLFLVLIFSLFTSYSIAETKIKYKTYNKLPCKFNGAKVTSTASPYAPKGKAPCLGNKRSGYYGKKGTTIEVKRGTPVFAVKDMKLLYAVDYSSEFNCINNESMWKKIKGTKIKILNHPHNNKKKLRCRYPWDGLRMVFQTVDNDKVLYYHLFPKTPLVPGIGKGKCKIRKFYKINNISGQRKEFEVNDQLCGGIKKKFVKKGELIGFVGHATSDHISFNLAPKEKGWMLRSPENEKHGLLWENYPKNPKAFLLPIMSKKYLKEIGYKK
jgi:hypothetical protein